MRSSRVFAYPEPEPISNYVFAHLDVVRPTQTHDGLISSGDLRIIFQSMRLVPGPRIIANILREAGGDRMDYVSFRAMRLERRKCELNVLAEFKKFDIDNKKKGLLTKKSLRKVLTFEGFSPIEVEEIAQSYMFLDHNKDGYVTYKDLFDYIMGDLKAEWREWLDRK